MSSKHPTSTTTAESPDKPTVPHWTHDYELVHLDEDAWEIIDLVAAARSTSYEEDETTDVLLGDPDTAQKHVTGVAGEVATGLALGIPVLETLDLTVSAKGDDGVDLVVRDGPWNQTSIDIKTYWGTPTGSPPQLLVEKDKAETGPAEVYIKCQVWNSNWAAVHGWTTQERLLDEGWIEGPPTWNRENWTMTADMLDPIETLDAETVGWQW